MTTANPQKKSSNYKVLIQVGMKLHNPQVIAAYKEYLDGEEQTIEPIYSKYLRLYPEDSVWEILIKFCLFYLVVDCGYSHRPRCGGHRRGQVLSHS